MTYAGLRRAVESGPMPRSEIVGNDQIEGASDGLIGRKAENSDRTRVPKIDDCGVIGAMIASVAVARSVSMRP